MPRFARTIDILTGVETLVPYTAEEEAAADAALALEAIPPDLDAIDTAALNAKLLEPGSVDRAELKTLFNHENRIRVLEAKAPITQAQFVAAIKATMRNGG